MTLPELQALLDSGAFHHATYRDFGTVWEGLRIYVCSPTGFQGYEPAGLFPKDSPDLKQAERLVAPTGVCVGSYARGG